MVKEQPPHRLALNVTAHAASNIWLIALAVVTLPFLLQGLGAAQFGLWALLQTLSASTGWLSLADAGVGAAMARQIALAAGRSAPDDARTSARQGLGIFLVLGILAGIAVATIGREVLPAVFNTPGARRAELREAVLAVAAAGALDLCARWANFCLEGVQRLDIGRLAEASRRTLVLVAASSTALITNSLSTTMWATVASSAAGLVLSLLLLGHYFPTAIGAPRLAGSRSLLRYGFTLALLGGVGVVHRTMDRIVVGAILGPAIVTPLEIATQVQNGASAVLTSTSYATSSSAAFLEKTPQALSQLWIRGTRLSLVATWPVVAVILVLADPALTMWLGSLRPPNLEPLVRLATIYIGVAAPAAVGSQILQGLGYGRSVLRSAVVAVSVNLVLTVLLVQVIGVEGAFIATLVAAAIVTVSILAASRSRLQCSFAQLAKDAIAPAVAPTIAAAAAAGVALALPWGPKTTTVVGGMSAVLAWGMAALRWSLKPGELREVLGRPKQPSGH